MVANLPPMGEKRAFSSVFVWTALWQLTAISISGYSKTIARVIQFDH